MNCIHLGSVVLAEWKRSDELSTFYSWSNLIFTLQRRSEQTHE